MKRFPPLAHALLPVMLGIYIAARQPVPLFLVVLVAALCAALLMLRRTASPAFAFIYIGSMAAGMALYQVQDVHLSGPSVAQTVNSALPDSGVSIVRLHTAPARRGEKMQALGQVLALRINNEWNKGPFPESVWLNLPWDSAAPAAYGDVMAVGRLPSVIRETNVPGVFSFAAWTRPKQIYSILNGAGVQVIKIGNEAGPVLSRVYSSRAFIDNLVQARISRPREAGVLTALLTGAGSAVDADTRMDYAETGTSHVLSVSGFHLSIIFYALSLLLMRLIPAHAYRLPLILLLIWGYAFFTGASAPVLRAALMVTLQQWGALHRRPWHGLSGLCAAALLILLFDSRLLFDVGFELSFAALAGIGLFAGPVERLWQPRSSVLKYFWALTAAGIAAQIATMPLTLYYFHQWPWLFIPANAVVIPLATAVMIIAFPALLLSILWPPAAWLPEGLLLIMNEALSFISSPAWASWKGIYISALVALAMGAALMAMGSRRYITAVSLLIAAAALHLASMFRMAEAPPRVAMWNIRGQAALAYIRSGRADFYTSARWVGNDTIWKTTLLPIAHSFHLRSHQVYWHPMPGLPFRFEHAGPSLILPRGSTPSAPDSFRSVWLQQPYYAEARYREGVSYLIGGRAPAHIPATPLRRYVDETGWTEFQPEKGAENKK